MAGQGTSSRFFSRLSRGAAALAVAGLLLADLPGVAGAQVASVRPEPRTTAGAAGSADTATPTSRPRLVTSKKKRLGAEGGSRSVPGAADRRQAAREGREALAAATAATAAENPVTSPQGDYLSVSSPGPATFDDTYAYCGYGPPPLFGGAAFVPCQYVDVYDATSADHGAPNDNSQQVWIYDACNNLVDTGYTYGWHQIGTNPMVLYGGWTTSYRVDVPWNTPSACYGEWTHVVSFTQTFTDGATLTASTAGTFTVYPDAPAAEQALAQSYGGASPIHAYQADPVDTFSGAFNHTSGPDLAMPALGAPLVVARTYSSNNPSTGPFGEGWSFTYQASVTVAGDGTVTYHAPTGAQQVFTPNGGGYAPAVGVRTSLSRNGDGTFTLIHKDQTRFRFDPSGRLSTIRDRNGQGLDLAYDGDGRLSTVSGSGRSLSFSHDPTSGLVTSVTSSDGRSVAYGYSPTGRLTTVTDANGATTRFGYDAGGRLDTVQDANGNFPVRLTYDADTGRAVEQLDARGNRTTFGWDPSTTTATTTDAFGNAWKDVYLNGYLIEQIDPLGQSTRYSWDDAGNMRRVSNPVGDTTAFRYDAAGNLVARELLGGSDPLVERFTYNGLNDLTSTTDFRGQSSYFYYDARDNLARTERPAGTVRSRFTYNADGTLASTTDARGQVTTYGYNSSGDLTRTTDPAGNTTTYTHDEAGRVTATVPPRGNATGIDPDDYRTSYTYDPVGRLLTTTDPLSAVVTNEYDDGGRLVRSVNARGKVTTTSYDASDHVTSVQGPDLAIPPLTYTYDANGNVATFTDSRGQTYRYGYDAANRLLQVDGPAGLWRRTYDAAGRLRTQTAPSGRAVTYAYESRGLPVQISYSDGTPTVTFAYDENGSRTSMTDGSGTVTYAYDNLDRVTSVTRGTDVTSYVWDANGNLTSRTFPGQTADEFGYDDVNRMTALTRGGNTLASYTYDVGAGRRVGTFANGSVETVSTDAVGRVSETSTVLGQTTLQRSAITYDANGNPTRILGVGDNPTSYTYDDLDRLTDVCYGVSTCAGATDSLHYTYDANNNRLTETRPGGTTTWAYDTANRMTARSGLAGNATYSYDADGNLLSGAGSTYTWNAQGLPTSSKVGRVSTTYTYDGEGRRLKATVGRKSTAFVWDPQSGQLALERDGTGTVLRRYTYARRLVGYSAAGKDYTYATDQLGSVRSVTDAAGTQHWSYEFEPYGTARSAVSSSRKAPANPMQFTGQYNEGGDYHLRARQYSPTDGVFRSPDAAWGASPGGGYGYASANPMVFTDPLGLYSWGEFLDDVNTVSGYVAAGAAVVTVACPPCAPVSAPVAGVAGAINVGTGLAQAYVHGTSGAKGASGEAVVMGAMAVAGGFIKVPGLKGLADDAVTGGWRVGDDIYAATRAGNSPAWSTVRSRYWKNEAANPQIDNWSQSNIQRMGRGAAPQRYNADKGGIESMELSHEPIPFRDGGTNVVPRWPQDHAAVDPFRRPGY